MYSLELAKKGFKFKYNGSESKWSIVISSAIPIKKREKLEDYYILVYKGDELIDRFYLEPNGVTSVNEADIPKYVKSTIEYIMSTGDINKYLEGKNIDNLFTRFGAKKEARASGDS
jgi:hypothetical protein